ncbi:hypothetical protein V1527DRAFT_449859 [Lipomyces starkeyi]
MIEKHLIQLRKGGTSGQEMPEPAEHPIHLILRSPCVRTIPLSIQQQDAHGDQEEDAHGGQDENANEEMIVGSGDRDCTICGLSLSDASALRGHLRSYHGRVVRQGERGGPKRSGPKPDRTPYMHRKYLKRRSVLASSASGPLSARRLVDTLVPAIRSSKKHLSNSTRYYTVPSGSPHV